MADLPGGSAADFRDIGRPAGPARFRQQYPYVFEAKLRGMSPWLGFTDVFERIVSGRTKVHELGRLLLWHWQAEQAAVAGNA
jgi:hypothetical protein